MSQHSDRIVQNPDHDRGGASPDSDPSEAIAEAGERGGSRPEVPPQASVAEPSFPDLADAERALRRYLEQVENLGREVAASFQRRELLAWLAAMLAASAAFELASKSLSREERPRRVLITVGGVLTDLVEP